MRSDAGDIADQRAAAEIELVARVLANPRIGAAVVIEAGITAATFDQPDARLLFAAADVGREDRLEKIDVLKLARRALRAEDLWDPTQIAGNALTSMRHSDATLARLATCRTFCPALVRQAADQLLSIIDQQKRNAEVAA